MALDKQAGNHYAMTTHGKQHFDAYFVNRPQDMRMFPISSQQNQTINVSMSSPILQSLFPPTGHSMITTNSIVSKPLGGVPVITPSSALPTPSSVIGTTDLRYLKVYFLFLLTVLFNNPLNMAGIGKLNLNLFCRDVAKSSGAPAQLTIFYAGSVSVYDDVSPEKVSIHFSAF
jgi:jasmonate ZIM domain-containing protein